MNKEILVQLIQNKDKKRKKMLCKFYQNYILMEASLGFIAQMISKDLEVDGIVSALDVKYCRWLLSKENIKSTQLPDIPIKTNFIEKPVVKNSNEIIWTDPDSEDYTKNSSLTTKFL
jgi:hypothetical protein